MTSAWTETKQRARAAREAALASTFLVLPDKQYGVLLTDPGWRFEPFSRETGVDRAADTHHVTEPATEIATLSDASIAAGDRQPRELASRNQPQDLQSWHGKGRRFHAGRPRKLVGTVAAASAK